MSADHDPEPLEIHGERLVYDNPWVKLALVDVEPPGGERFEHHVVRLSHVATKVSEPRHDAEEAARIAWIPLPWARIGHDQAPRANLTALPGGKRARKGTSTSACNQGTKDHSLPGFGHESRVPITSAKPPPG